MEEFCAGDGLLVSKCKEISSWFRSQKALMKHALNLTLEASVEEVMNMMLVEKWVLSIVTMLWAMKEAMEASDPQQ